MARNKPQKRKKRHGTVKPVTHVPLKKREKTKKLITKLHVANKEMEKLQFDSKLQAKEKHKKMKLLESQVKELGGLHTYQLVSKLGEYHHGNTNTSKWVVKKLQEHNIKPSEGKKLELLDVGALALNYEKQRWINCTSIDLNPQDRNIIKADFLQFKDDCCEFYDVLVLSLVINFVGDPVKRGEMLKKATLLLKPEGYLFVVLPLACLENSRYFSARLFKEMLSSLGYETVMTHDSKKLAFVLAQKQTGISHKNFKKRLVRDGQKRNNFTIVLRWGK